MGIAYAGTAHVTEWALQRCDGVVMHQHSVCKCLEGPCINAPLGVQLNALVLVVSGLVTVVCIATVDAN